MERAMVDGTRANRLLWPAAGLSFIAGLMHWLVSPEYLGQWWGYGYFFIVAGVLQMVYAFAIFLLPWVYPPETQKPSVMRDIYLLGVAGNAAIILLFIITRTLGVPFVGPAASVVLPVTARGALTTAAELVLVALLIALSRQQQVRRAGASQADQAS